jgi:integral membrane sensor domain MASE1
MELITFILAAYGLTQILVYGSIFKGWRPTEGKLGELFRCPMCMGFWVGVLLMFLSPFTELFSFDVSVDNFLILGCISSGTSYILNMTFGDEGIKLSKTVEVKND